MDASMEQRLALPKSEMIVWTGEVPDMYGRRPIVVVVGKCPHCGQEFRTDWLKQLLVDLKEEQGHPGPDEALNSDDEVYRP